VQGFLPFCLEAFPYDISELSTYSQLRDVYESGVRRPGLSRCVHMLGIYYPQHHD
jgi:hypothetical protein